MDTRKKNPFRVSYLSMVVICCLALSIIFYCTDYMSNQRTQKEYNQKKVDLMMEDLEAQLLLMKEVSLRIATNNQYQPSYLKKNKYNENIMLEDFEQYKFYSTLAEECFLYYSGDTIFHSSGFTMSLNIYLRGLSEEERTRFWEEVTEIKEGTTQTRGGMYMLSMSGDIYVLLPFQVSESTGRSRAILCFVIGHDDLGERFQIVSGGIKGNLSFYSGNVLLYCNQGEACSRDQKRVLTAGTSDGLYTLCYLPEKESFIQNSLFWSQFLLILTGVILVFLIANVFAERSYRPIMEMSEKYRNEVAMSEEIQCENALEEINYMMESMLRSNVAVNMQIEQKQRMLKNQILRMVLEGSASFDVGPYLDRLQIRLPGPYFYVISISFERENGITEEFLTGLQKELEQISSEEEKEYVHAVYNFKEKCMNVICSVAQKEQKEELTGIVCGVAESFEYEPFIGSGNIYQTLLRMPASWLESVDNIYNKGGQQKREEQHAFVYDSEELGRICAALTEGNETGALEGLERFVAQLTDRPMSY